MGASSGLVNRGPDPLGKSQVSLEILVGTSLEKQMEPRVQLLLEGGSYGPLSNTLMTHTKKKKKEKKEKKEEKKTLSGPSPPDLFN